MTINEKSGVREGMQMTPSLEQAFAESKKLPEVEQDELAAVILAEISDERKWSEAFERTEDQLGRLAEKVRADIRAGRVRPGGFGEV